LKLETIAEDIGKFGLYSAIMIVIVLLIRFGVERSEKDDWDSGRHIGDMLKFFIIAITVVVVAIPEGLPLSVTLSLAYSVKKMLTD
jgi:magnesium-transporting ATPase (P-type)